MESAVLTFRDEAGWKFQIILRPNRFYNTDATMHLYKARLLGYIGYRTLSIYHSATSSLKPDRYDSKSISQIDRPRTREGLPRMQARDLEFQTRHGHAWVDPTDGPRNWICSA